MSGTRPFLPSEKIADFCRRHRIRKLSLFGSVLLDDFRPESDIDVLVEFEPGARRGLTFFAKQDELSTILGRKVDLNTPCPSLSAVKRRTCEIDRRSLMRVVTDGVKPSGLGWKTCLRILVQAYHPRLRI
ncbi:MAG: nucleotidyltransferase family protein [Thermoguttaceae bacterium]